MTSRPSRTKRNYRCNLCDVDVYTATVSGMLAHFRRKHNTADEYIELANMCGNFGGPLGELASRFWKVRNSAAVAASEIHRLKDELRKKTEALTAIKNYLDKVIETGAAKG